MYGYAIEIFGILVAIDSFSFALAIMAISIPEWPAMFILCAKFEQFSKQKCHIFNQILNNQISSVLAPLVNTLHAKSIILGLAMANLRHYDHLVSSSYKYHSWFINDYQWTVLNILPVGFPSCHGYQNNCLLDLCSILFFPLISLIFSGSTKYSFGYDYVQTFISITQRSWSNCC